MTMQDNEPHESLRCEDVCQQLTRFLESRFAREDDAEILVDWSARVWAAEEIRICTVEKKPFMT